ncbi:transferase [Salmonella enterica subsp. enterica]|uniref:Transferase n=1 Tax=Salmonella enterica I TaxID=59201 RepID=A0A447TU63_SALET|nr:transferase [Salmonella enterica subsp. enterica]
MSDTLRPYKDLFPEIGQRVMIDTSSVVIGDVRLADDIGIWPLVVIRGDVNYVAIGARTNIQDGSVSSRNPQVFIQSTRQPINHWRRCYRWP